MLAALRWLVFALFALLMNFPVIATLVTSLKSPREIATNPGLWIEAPTLENYVKVLAMSDRLTLAHLCNSLVISLIGSGLALLARAAGRLRDGPRRRRAPDAAAAHRQPARHPADHLRDPDLHDVPVARAARHPASASA